MYILVPYNTATAIYFPLITAGSQDYQANPTIAAGDFKVTTDGGALANADNLPAVTPAAGVQVKWTVSAAETTGKVVTLVGIDVAGAEWEDQMIVLYTYGHASAFFQFDFGSANVHLARLHR